MKIPNEIEVNDKKAKLITAKTYKHVFPTDHGLLIAKGFYVVEENGKYLIYSVSWYSTLQYPIISLFMIVSKIDNFIKKFLEEHLEEPVYYTEEEEFEKKKLKRK